MEWIYIWDLIKHIQVTAGIKKGCRKGPRKTVGGTPVKASVAEWDLVVHVEPRGSPWTAFSGLDCFVLTDCFYLYKIPHLHIVFT